MATNKGKKNLNRGNIPAGKTPAEAAEEALAKEEAPPKEDDRSIEGHPNLRKWPLTGNPNLQAGLAAAKETDEKVRQRVIEDPDASLEEIHASITVLASALLRRAARERAKMPDRELMNIVREFRQTQEALNEARRARGAVAEVQEFFAQMDSRLEEVTSRLEACIEPAVAVPA